MTNKRGKDVNWSKLANETSLRSNHDEFTTQGGCRKHVKNKRSWCYYFDGKPDSAQIDTLNVNENNKSGR